MRIGNSREGAFGYGGRPPRDALPPAAPASRALTVMSAPSPREAPAVVRGDAAFLAHLIATKEQLPQTRIKRRAEPDVALALYRAVAEMVS